MANNKEHVTKKFVTPKGTLKGFIALFEPSTKFNKKGIYTAEILLSKEEGEKLAEEIKNVRTEQFKKFGKGTKVADITRCVPYTTANEETGEAIPDKEGRYVFKTNRCAYIEGGKPKVKIMVVDSKCNPIKDASIGEGTTAILSGELSGYSVAGKTGVSVKLKGVQILDLVEYSSTSVESLGFTQQDGFEVSDEPVTTEEEATEDSEEAEEEDF